MSIIDFKYKDKLLSDFGMVVCVFDGNVQNTKVGTRLSFQTVKVPSKNNSNVVSHSYDESLQVHLQVGSYDCGSGSFEPLSADFIRKVICWLSSYNFSTLDFFTNDNDYNDMYYVGAFTSIDLINYNNETYGFDLVFTTDRPYALAKEKTLNIETFNNRKVKVIVDNDETGDIPTKTKIVVLEEGDLELINHTSNTKTKIKNCLLNEQILFNSETLEIESSKTEHNIADDFNYEYPTLFKEENKKANEFSANIHTKIEFKYNGSRKVGTI